MMFLYRLNMTQSHWPVVIEEPTSNKIRTQKGDYVKLIYSLTNKDFLINKEIIL
jgi:hypothetical protein